MSRRSLFAAGGALAATAGLSSCGIGSSSELTFFQASKREAVGYFSEVVQKYNAAHDSVTVQHDISSNLQATFVRRNPPDLACHNYDQSTRRYLERGAFIDLSDLPSAQQVLPSVQELVEWYPQYEDRTSVIPFSVASAAVIYNRTIFEEQGLEVPTTWSAFVEVCEALQAADITPIYGTWTDAWTLNQGMFDYTVGGLMDVRGFFASMTEIGEDVGPDSELSFQKDMLGPVQKMLELLPYHQDNAASRTYGDGNTAIAQGQAAMYFQGPWAMAEIAKAETDVDISTFPLPVTEDPADLKVRLNLDLALWIPEIGSRQEEAKELLNHLMTPEEQYPYNEALLAFNTLQDAPEVTDPRIAPMYDFYLNGQFYMGASQLIPQTIPWENYLQSIVFGADPERVLARLDTEWANLAYRA